MSKRIIPCSPMRLNFGPIVCISRESAQYNHSLLLKQILTTGTGDMRYINIQVG